MAAEQKEGGLAPKAQVFARATELGFEPSDERFERFRREGLIGDLERIEGTTQHGFTRAQAYRFIALLGFCKALGKRPRRSALAFWLCWYRFDDVPPDLVCEHVERTMLAFIKYMRREFARKRVPIYGVRDPKSWEKAGQPWSKTILKTLLQRARNNPIAQQFFSWTIGVALRALISPPPFAGVARVLRQIAALLGLHQDKTEALEQLWLVLSEGAQLFKLSEAESPLLNVVREVRAANPSDMVELVRDTQLTLAVMGTCFSRFDIRNAPFPEVPGEKISVDLGKHLGPAMVSVTALTRNAPHGAEMRRRFRAGDFDAGLAEFHQFKIIADEIKQRIGAGENQ